MVVIFLVDNMDDYFMWIVILKCYNVGLFCFRILKFYD